MTAHSQGLCATCAHKQTVTSDRQTQFTRCGLAATNPNFPKYPPLPVLACRGWRDFSRTAQLPLLNSALARAQSQLAAGDRTAAEASLRKATVVDPSCAAAWSLLTDLLAASGRAPEAIQALAQLIATADPTPDNLYIAADKSAFLKQYKQARQLLQQALLHAFPARINAAILLAQIDYMECDFYAAIELATDVLHSHPNNLEALDVRQKSWFRLGRASEDVADTQRILQLRPNVDMHSRLLFKLNYLAETTPESLYQESARWNTLYAAPLARQIVSHPNDPDPDRRLRIGYLSPDLKHHAIMKLLPAAFEQYDREHFEIFAYSLGKDQDSHTDYVRRTIANFQTLHSSREAIVRQVRADRIDILVDLAGHTMMDANAYLAFALKPAPVQVTWMGAMATTGLSAMDYFLGDPHLPLPGTERFFSEKIYRLPRLHCCYRPAAPAAIGASPYFRNGHLTFGSFNNPHKIARQVAQVWSVVLHLHPGSKLLFKYGGLDVEPGQRHLRQWFLDDGIADERLLFEGRATPSQYLAAWNTVDIALDPFPYNGGTTTLDALYMGVPVVSLAGQTAVSRAGFSILSAVGLPVAENETQYVALAAKMAESVRGTPDLRQRIHTAAVNSAMMDEAGMMRHLETAFREMWRAWCLRQTSEEDFGNNANRALAGGQILVQE